MTSTSPIVLPSRATGTPASNAISTYAGFAGASSGEVVHSYASSGGSTQGSSSTPHSQERPQRFSSMLYGDSTVTGTGMPRAFAHSISSSLVIFHSRIGAMISSVGSSAAVATSNRTWSLPLPVQPWATAVALYLCASVDLELRDQRPRKGGRQRISAPIERVGPQRRHHEIFRELFTRVDHLGRQPPLCREPSAGMASMSPGCPTSAQTATTSKPFSSASQRTSTDVSSPPE